MATTINKKIENMYRLMAKLAKGEELYPQDENLQEMFFEDTGDTPQRTLRRYLEDIHQLYRHIVLTEKKKKDLTDRKVTVYRVPDKEKDVSKVFKFFMENSDELGWVLQMIHENDPSFLKELKTKDKHLIEESLQEDAGIFMFNSTPFENFEDSSKKEIFNNLKKAVKNHEYRTIEYEKNKMVTFENMKCLKLVYMNNNWYLATEDEEKKFFWLRLSFMYKVNYADHDKITFQKSRVDYYGDFFSSVQNAMTLANVNFKKTTLKASPCIALYFKESMKPFFSSQEYVRTEEDGSIIFTVEYTQAMEVLPFVKQWLPDISIVEPDSLKEAFVKDMQKSIALHS